MITGAASLMKPGLRLLRYSGGNTRSSLRGQTSMEASQDSRESFALSTYGIANEGGSVRKEVLLDVASLLQPLLLRKPIQLFKPVCHDIQPR